MKTSINKRSTVLAACAFALATAVSSYTAAETQAIEKIERYCAASWRNAGIHPQEWQDCTQQALFEFLTCHPPSDLVVAIGQRGSAARRELNRAVWRIVMRIRRQVALVEFDENFFYRTSGPNFHEEWPAIEKLARSFLSARQRQVLELVRDGWTIAEISELMKVSPSRVSDMKHKAITKLRKRIVPV